MIGRPSLPTLKDVAEHAGVSPTTASMALSGRTGNAKLAGATIQRVHASARALGYRGNYHARTLSSGRSHIIGLAVGAGPLSVLAHRFWSPICGGVEATARARGYDVLLIGGTAQFEPLERALHHLEARQLDALIVLPALYGSLPSILTKSHLPIVLLDSAAAGSARLPRVRFDEAPGVEAAIDHLAKLGHRSMLWIGAGGVSGVEDEARRAVIAAAAARHGVAVRPQRYEAPASSMDGAPLQVAGYRQALQERPFPADATAILCWNEAIALAAYGILADAGRSIPRDVSVIGFDDLIADLASPALTTISHACHELGAALVALAIDLIEGRDRAARARVETVRARLIVRASTGPAPRP